MKKLPTNYRLRQKRIEEDRFKRKNRPGSRRETLPTHTPGKPVNRPRRWQHGLATQPRIPGYKQVNAPTCIALTPEFADSVIPFVQELGSKAVGGNKVMIDFFKTKRISALGAVYLYSEIDRALMKASAKIRIRGVSSRQVRHALDMTGIFTLCKYPAPLPSPHIPVLRGTDDNHLSKIVEYLMNTALVQKELNNANPAYAERLVNTAISEAMLNVKQHAYPQSEPNAFWWATAAILDNNLHIALCDRGVGIPKTLVEKGMFKAVLAALKTEPSDAEMIKAAMEYTRSSRKARGGGLGSRDIQQLVLDAREGHLTIISGEGYYHLQGKNNNQIAQKIGYDVAGTLIQWQIPLHRQSEAPHE